MGVRLCFLKAVSKEGSKEQLALLRSKCTKLVDPVFSTKTIVSLKVNRPVFFGTVWHLFERKSPGFFGTVWHSSKDGTCFFLLRFKSNFGYRFWVSILGSDFGQRFWAAITNCPSSFKGDFIGEKPLHKSLKLVAMFFENKVSTQHADRDWESQRSFFEKNRSLCIHRFSFCKKNGRYSGRSYLQSCCFLFYSQSCCFFFFFICCTFYFFQNRARSCRVIYNKVI